ncbi:helix-turn-helix domain-containing protein [Planctomicrobium sp. SH661]|uniref:helix-turn-helix domain-containing protein n=1 Tax=Planctomicrobium sp. SH661 TaxID=3448124 RepID=UPI003F5B5545
MSKKYLSLDEAASMLGLAPEELVRLREKGEVRGFADRGTWKFKHEDIESLQRRRQADSNPEVPLMDLPAPSAKNRPDLGEQPTVIRKDRPIEHDDNLLAGDTGLNRSDSDSDVRLVGGPDLDLDFDVEGDSDVKLVGLRGSIPNNAGTDPEIVIKKPGSDSDVRLVRSDSDSDVTLAGDNSDSDVQLVGGATELELSLKDIDEGGTDHDLTQKKPQDLYKSDSDVKLVAGDSPQSIGDVTLMDDDDDAIAIDFNPDRSRNASVLDDESGISLGRDSSLLLGESGISLAGPSDSGIALELNSDDDGLTLALDEDSGITLDAGESGISLEAADSGISLEPTESGISLADDSHGGTVPMMDIFADDEDGGETQFEVPSLSDDSDYDATGVMDVVDGSASDAVFDLDEDQEAADGEYAEDDMDLEASGFEDEEDLDVFDADEGAFAASGAEGYAAPASGRMRAAETEWDTATFVGLSIGSLLLIVCGLVMIDLVKNTATAETPNPVSGQVIEILGGLYK